MKTRCNRHGEHFAIGSDCPSCVEESSLTRGFTELIGEVMAECDRARRKFPSWPHDPIHAAAVVFEEAGELQKAVLEHTYEPHKSNLDDVRDEAIQTAAMALRFLRSLDEYRFQPAEQHEQR